MPAPAFFLQEIPSLYVRDWRSAYADNPFYKDDYTYEQDYVAAYRVGYEGRYRHQGTYVEHEQNLAIEWERIKNDSHLTWDQAKVLAWDAWDRVERRQSEYALANAETRFQQEVMNGEWEIRPITVEIDTSENTATTLETETSADSISVAVEAVVGRVMSGVANNDITETVTPLVDHNAYWRDHYRSRPGYRDGYTYADDYAAAYRLGYESHNFYKTPFEDNETELKVAWERLKGSSRLTWEEAKTAMREAWDRIEGEIPVNALDSREV